MTQWNKFVNSLSTDTLSQLSAWVSAEAREMKRNTGDTMSAREISVKLDNILDERWKAQEAILKAEESKE